MKNSDLRVLVLEAVAAVATVDGGDAYGLVIARWMHKRLLRESWWTRFFWYYGRQYLFLAELEALGLVDHKEEPGGHERGYYPRRCYRLTPAGRAAVKVLGLKAEK